MAAGRLTPASPTGGELEVPGPCPWGPGLVLPAEVRALLSWPDVTRCASRLSCPAGRGSQSGGCPVPVAAVPCIGPTVPAWPTPMLTSHSGPGQVEGGAGAPPFACLATVSKEIACWSLGPPPQQPQCRQGWASGRARSARVLRCGKEVCSVVHPSRYTPQAVPHALAGPSSKWSSAPRCPVLTVGLSRDGRPTPCGSLTYPGEQAVGDELQVGVCQVPCCRRVWTLLVPLPGQGSQLGHPSVSRPPTGSAAAGGHGAGLPRPGPPLPALLLLLALLPAAQE